jgi:hypothetical protein
LPLQFVPAIRVPLKSLRHPSGTSRTTEPSRHQVVHPETRTFERDSSGRELAHLALDFASNHTVVAM